MNSTHKLCSFLLSGSFLFASSGRAAEDCQPPEDWLNLVAEQEGANAAKISHVAIDLDNDNIPMGQPFSFDLSHCHTQETTIKRVTATALMPAHLHGMNYTPEVTQHTDSTGYYIEGFLFHMPGIWKITVSFYVDNDAEHFSTEVTVN